jgi:thymidylate synthase
MIDMTQAFLWAVEMIDVHGERVEVKRVGASANYIFEVSPMMIQIVGPYRIPLVVERHGNPFASLFETIWVLSGDRDVSVLKHFLPRAPQYADDGVQWRAGYGPRLRRSYGLSDVEYSRFYKASAIENRAVENYAVTNLKSVDQIQYVCETLKADPTSKRAVMSIWDPAKDCRAGDSLDYPCTGYIQYKINNGKLDCFVTMRSNDLLFGFSQINVFEFSFIQGMLSRILGVGVGRYYHFAGSLHVYENMKDRLKKILMANVPHYCIPVNTYEPFIGDDCYYNISEAKRFVKYVQSLWEEDLDCNLNRLRTSFSRNVMGEDLYYMAIYAAAKKMDPIQFYSEYKNVFRNLRNTDMKLAAYYWIRHNALKDNASYERVSVEMLNV